MSIPAVEAALDRAGYRAFAAMWTNAFEDGRLEIVSLTVTDDVVVVELLGRGTHSGDLVLGESWPFRPPAQRARCDSARPLGIRDGQIMDVELEFDLQDLNRQLGC